MTGTEQKPPETILGMLTPEDSVYVIGCGCCARLCETGGAPQVEAMAEFLRAEGREVVGALTPTEACHADLPSELAPHRTTLDAADCVLALCCDSGCRNLTANLAPKPVHAGLRTLST
jgi:hypothetical protein